MKILYITNICNIGPVLVSEARQKNIEAYYIEYPWAKRKIRNLFQFGSFLMNHNICSFDVYHYNWPIASLLPNNKDIVWLKKKDRKIFLHYHGSDIRYKKEKRILKDVHGKFISTPDLFKFLPDATWLPFPFDIRGLERKTTWNETPFIIHAPSDRQKKGTDIIVRAVNELKKTHRVTFELIEHRPPSYVQEKMSMADIVIDQIGPGWYGKVTLEALYSGAVSCFYMDRSLLKYVPFEFHADITPDSILDTLIEILEDESLRNQLRSRGYEYLIQYHDSQKIMDRLMKFYES